MVNEWIAFDGKISQVRHHLIFKETIHLQSRQKQIVLNIIPEIARGHWTFPIGFQKELVEVILVSLSISQIINRIRSAVSRTISSHIILKVFDSIFNIVVEFIELSFSRVYIMAHVTISTSTLKLTLIGYINNILVILFIVQEARVFVIT